MKNPIALLVILALAPGWAAACSVMSGYAPFAPDPKSFARDHPDAFYIDVPMPKVVVGEVTPATSDLAGSCANATWFEIEVSLPEDSPYDFADMGLVFRSEPVIRHPFFFPAMPIVSTKPGAGGKVARFRVGLEDPPARRAGRASKLRLEVFAITHELKVGPSAFVFVPLP